jgi:translation initiation factor IF-1
MEENNTAILEELINQRIYVEELIKKGFKDNKIIARDTRQANSFLGQITYHDATYYQGLTLEIVNNEKVSVKPNNLKEIEADVFNHVRDLEIKIESFGDIIWANRFEYKDEAAAKELEIERHEYQEILNDLKSAKEKILLKKQL